MCFLLFFLYRRASFVFLVPGQIWDPRAEHLARAGLGTFLEQTWGPKNVVLWRNDFPNRVYGVPPEGNGLYGDQEAFGQVISPLNPPRKLVPRGFPLFPGN